MAASAEISKTIYVGTFVHSISLAELEIGENGAIGVDENGVIQFVHKDVDLKTVHEEHPEWREAKIAEVKGNGFFFPGFVGMFYPLTPISNRHLHLHTKSHDSYLRQQ